MRKRIPAPVISAVAYVVSERETHASLDSLFMHAGASDDPPCGSKHAKALEWLRRVNRDESVDPLEVLGAIIEGYLDEDLVPLDPQLAQRWHELNERIRGALLKANLRYVRGGHITGATAMPSQSLEQHMRKANIEPVNAEFERALNSVSKEPPEALSAACNILESLFKVYIEENNLEEPSRKDIGGLWKVVKDDLNFDPSAIEDDDLRRILSGMASVVGGLGALRTHASTAHGSGKKRYRVEERHARLAVHAAHTLALFVLETWEQRT